MTSEKKPFAVEEAIFAGGCFWCMTPPFQKLEGVKSVVAGYVGGSQPNPTYQDYAQKGYVEAVKIIFDPTIITYQELLNVFWRQIDPTDEQGQFVDRGRQYRSAIFFNSNAQQKIAQDSRKALIDSSRFAQNIATEIVPYSTFYPAEDYHQDYHLKNPLRYSWYRYRSGRDQFIAKTWKTNKKEVADKRKKYTPPTPVELRRSLTPLQYNVTQEGGTEKPFENEYWDLKEVGIFVDRISGTPLFSSSDKYNSGTGWPSFTQPINADVLVLIQDTGDGRVEVKSRVSNSHLGHVFNDGPAPQGLRYCINSAALRFIPFHKLEDEGYDSYKHLLKK